MCVILRCISPAFVGLITFAATAWSDIVAWRKKRTLAPGADVTWSYCLSSAVQGTVPVREERGFPPLRTCSHYLISSGGLFQKSPYDGSICVQCWRRLVRLESGHSSCLCVLYKLVLFVLSTQKGSEGCQLCLLSPSMAMCVCWRERGQVGGATRLTDQCGQVEDSHYRGGRCTVPAFFAVALCVSLSADPVYLFTYLGQCIHITLYIYGYLILLFSDLKET